MRQLRSVYVAGTALAMISLVLAAWGAQLQRQIARAEYYAQSGVSSFSYVCSSVSSMLRQTPQIPVSVRAGHPVLEVADRCEGDVLNPNRKPKSVDPAIRFDHEAIARRIDQRIAERALPFLTLDPVTSRRLPKGYKERDRAAGNDSRPQTPPKAVRKREAPHGEGIPGGGD